jgi:twinkle protein
MILFNPSNKKEHVFSFRKSTGEEAFVCPECSEDRKKKNIKCFSYNHDKNIGHCIHCNCYLVPKREFEAKKEYVRPPKWTNKTNLSEKLVKWFEKERGITQKTLIDFNITEGPEYMPQLQKEVNTIQFNYFRNGELINIKYRDGLKNFKLFKDGELIFYNLDSIKDCDEVIVCEGEIDALTIAQAYKKNVVSIPNGAGLNKINLDYLDNCISYFANKKKIYLATDNDAPGRNLQEQLADRLGKERCYKVTFKDCKDANECLVKYGPQSIIESFADKKEFPLEGVYTISDYSDAIDDIYEHGLPKGSKTMMGNLNKLLSFHKGYITTITGIPNQGKSDCLDQITLQLSLTSDWKGAFYSPENKPTSLHITKLARKLIGKDWWGNQRISKDEIKLAKEYLDERFFFIKPESNFTLDSILKHVRELVVRKGIDYFVIDAWNKLEHKYGGDENKYIGECLDKLGTFCENNNIHLFLVAHPRKMTKDKFGKYEVPNLYDISGSANFFNKSDNGICVYRDYDNEISKWYVQKVKFSHWGSQGMCEFKYDLESGRFNEYGGGALPPSFDKTPWIHGVKQHPVIEHQAIDSVNGMFRRLNLATGDPRECVSLNTI